ncbi:MAG: glycerol-3-phosphate responsive antiterminator [Clostridiales bacterium]|jgi:glycerol uptake operon antiterminator|nr:glycerol-3-phosphate responsive antiterminator [Clostridiales bacterium]
MNQEFIDAVESSPIITAINDMEGLARCLESDSKVVFILFGDICSIPDIVDQIKAANKIALVHIDLISGLSSKEIAVDFIKKYTKADGIITTKHSLIKRAKELSLYTVLRIFIIDSMALHNIEKLSTVRPDYIEVLPGLMPKIIKQIASISSVPIIAGGLISDKEDVISVLSSGATSISTSNMQVWFM